MVNEMLDFKVFNRQPGAFIYWKQNKYLLSIYYVPGPIGAGDTAVIKIDSNPFP